MKIYCEKCKQDISKIVDTNIESYSSGRLRCPHCSKQQQRYISEADLMMYFTISCLFYIIAAYVIAEAFVIVGLSWYLIPIILLLLIGCYFIQKYISRYVYEKAPGKTKWKNIPVSEDEKSITKRMRYQQAIFTCLIILLGTGTGEIWMFAVVALIFTIVCLIKTISLIKKEKTSTI